MYKTLLPLIVLHEQSLIPGAKLIIHGHKKGDRRAVSYKESTGRSPGCVQDLIPG